MANLFIICNSRPLFFESIRAMTASVTATVPPFSMIRFREDDKSLGCVVVVIGVETGDGWKSRSGHKAFGHVPE